MTRVSLKEAYDNKDVVAQIYAIRDTAESAEDSAEQAVTTANTASEHVDALVPQVEGAVQNANSASASAQASAQTVAGYENRLATVETDLNAVTLRVTIAEGDIVTIQGRVTALETADGQNVKINAINDYAVGLSGNQENITGIKGFVETIRGRVTNVLYAEYNGNLTTGKYRQFAKIPAENINTLIVLDVMISANGSNYGFGRLLIGNPTTTSWFCKWVYRKSNAWLTADAIRIARETATGDLMIFAKNPTTTGLSVNLVYSKSGSDIQGAVRVEKVTNTTDYSLDGTDSGIENVITGVDM